MAKKVEKAIAAYKAGMFVADIGHKFGVYTKELYKELRDRSIPLRRGPTTKRRLAIQRALATGKKANIIAAKHNVSRQYVSQIKKRSIQNGQRSTARE